MKLLEEHIFNNTVISPDGDVIYRQKIGIPQGSCLSTVMCK